MKNYTLQGIILKATDKVFLFTCENLFDIYRFLIKLYFYKSKMFISII